jgi:hypothetical protein
MLTKTWRDILELAQRAPSPHNVQPWMVRLTSDQTCDVYISIDRTLPQEDTTGSFIISGMVMYLETMRYAAQIYGHDLQYKLLMDQPAAENGRQLFASVTIKADKSIVPEFSREVMLQRRTSRLSYSRKPIAVADHAALQALVASHGYTYGHMVEASRIEQAVGLDIKALFHDLNAPSYHDEIVSWFRYSNRSSEQHRDGLDFRCMRIPATEYYLSAHLPFILKLPIIGTVFAGRYRKILGTVPCVAWLSGKFWQPEDAVSAGKLLIHFWLEVTRLGLYLHPFGNLVTNTAARSGFEKLTGSSDVWFVIRIGYSDEPPESYRLPLEQILIGEGI